MVQLIGEMLPKYVKASPFDIQVLTPMRKGSLGVETLNGVLQSCLNPPSEGKKEVQLGDTLFREGDKVMQIRNNYDIVYTRDDGEQGVGVYNGDIGTIGISDHAQAELSDVVFVDLPEVGATVAAGDPVAVVESVKAASDVYTPVSGEILEVNEELSNDPSLINSDPYGAGWLYKIRLDVPTETEDMMNATDYEEYCS